MNISPLPPLFVWLVGVCFDPLCVRGLSHESSRSVISGSEGRHEGVRTAFFFFKWVNSLFGAAQALGLKGSEVKRGRASNSLLTQRHARTHAHTAQRWKWLGFSEHTYCTRVLFTLIWRDLWCYIPPCCWCREKACPFLSQILSKKLAPLLRFVPLKARGRNSSLS